MSKIVQRRRGTTAEHTTFTGAVAELTVDTTKDTVVVHDGAAAGGFPLLREDGSNSALAIGSAGTPSLKFTGDPNTGLYSPGADQVAISTDGTGRLFVDASGNVALGAATFSKPFTIVNTNAAIALRANSGGTYTDHGIFFAVDGTNYSQIYNEGIGNLIFRTGSGLSERLRITSTGNVGIGTSAPGTLLDTRGFASYRGNAYAIASFAANNTLAPLNIVQSNNGTAAGISAGQNSVGAYQPLELMTSELARVTILPDGNVGIGTSSPTHNLDVSTSAQTTVRAITTETSGSSVARMFMEYMGSGASNTQADLRVGANYGLLGVITNHPLLFRTNNTERCRIDASGRLLVGTSASITTLVQAGLQAHGTGALGYINSGRWSNDGNRSELIFSKSRGGTVGTRALVSADDGLGGVTFTGDDGASFVQAANIIAYVDGTPGTNDMPGRLVFSTTADGAASPTEQLRITNGGTVVYNQPAPAAVDVTATLTVANLTATIITSSTAAAVTMTLPTGTLMDGGFSGLYTNMAFEWSVINTGATNAVTVQGGTGHTVVGSGTVAASNSGRFVSRRTAATTWVSYRLSS